MTFEAIAGSILAGLSILFVVGNLVTAYRTEGGSIGQVPVMAPPVFGSATATLGLLLVEEEAGWPGWPWWGFGLFWLGFTLLAWYATIYAGRLGARRRDPDDLDD